MNMRARACTKPQSRKDYNPHSLSEVTVMTTRRALMQGAAALAHARASDLVPDPARGWRRSRAAAAHLHGVTTTLGFASVRAAPTHQQASRQPGLQSGSAQLDRSHHGLTAV